MLQLSVKYHAFLQFHSCPLRRQGYAEFLFWQIRCRNKHFPRHGIGISHNWMLMCTFHEDIRVRCDNSDIYLQLRVALHWRPLRALWLQFGWCREARRQGREQQLLAILLLLLPPAHSHRCWLHLFLRHKQGVQVRTIKNSIQKRISWNRR